METKKLRIGALISGGGTNLQAVIDSCSSGKLEGRVVFTGSDNPLAKGLDRAEKAGIPTFVADYGKISADFDANPDSVDMPSRNIIDRTLEKQSLYAVPVTPRDKTRLLKKIAAEHQLLSAIRTFQFDLLILAGFMRTLTPYFIDEINDDPHLPRIMNIHPALLPAFPGTDGYGDTFRYGCKVGGCTVHFVDYGEDTGPIIGQKVYSILPEDTLDSVKAKGLKLEWQLYPACISMFANKRLKVVEAVYTQGRKTFTRKIVEIRPIGDTS